MNITVIHVMRTYGVHGGENQLAQLFTSFSEPGFRHHFIFLYRDDICMQYFSKIKGLTTSLLLSFKSNIFPSLIAEILTLLFLLPILQIRLLFILRQSHARICVAHGVQGAAVAWLSAIFLHQVRFVYVHRGTKSSKNKHSLLSLLYRPFDKIAGVSHASADSLRSIVPGKLPVAIENGINWQAVERQLKGCPNISLNDSFVFICVGRLISAKGQELIIDSFAEVCKHVANAELRVIGMGTNLNSLKSRSEMLGIANKVHFLGERKDVICLLGDSEVFIHASESEGLSNAVLEAMAVGLPSVVVAAPGVTECHIDNETAFIVSRSPAEVSARLLLLASDSVLRKSMGMAAKERVRNVYSIEANCMRYFTLYQQLITSAH